jgi:hypothetical protein
LYLSPSATPALIEKQLPSGFLAYLTRDTYARVH